MIGTEAFFCATLAIDSQTYIMPFRNMMETLNIICNGHLQL